MNEKISVVVPMYNCSDTIHIILDAILAQTYPIDELILVDDGSTDATESVVTQYISEHPDATIMYYKKTNGGAASSRNYGILRTRNNFIATCDSDDVWAPQKITNEMKLFDKYPDAALVGSNLNGKVYKRFYHIKFDKDVLITSNMQLFKNFFQPSAIIFKKDVLLKVLPELFPETQRHAEEGIVFLALTKHAKSYLLNDSFVTYGFGKPGFGHSGLSANLELMQKGEMSNFRRFYKQKDVNFLVYSLAVAYSNIKYIRRVIMTKLRSVK